MKTAKNNTCPGCNARDEIITKLATEVDRQRGFINRIEQMALAVEAQAEKVEQMAAATPIARISNWLYGRN